MAKRILSGKAKLVPTAVTPVEECQILVNQRKMPKAKLTRNILGEAVEAARTNHETVLDVEGASKEEIAFVALCREDGEEDLDDFAIQLMLSEIMED